MEWDELPVWKSRGKFFEVFRNSDVCFVHAATGSGKSTLVPVLLCMYEEENAAPPGWREGERQQPLIAVTSLS